MAEALGPDPDDPIASDLYNHQRGVDGFQQAADEARRDRDQAVRRAVADGYPRKRISEITGLSRGRIAQIANRTH